MRRDNPLSNGADFHSLGGTVPMSTIAGFDIASRTVVSPEPSTPVLFGPGAAALAFRVRRRIRRCARTPRG